MEENSEKILSKIVCIEGDLTQADLGLSNENLKELLDGVTVVFHSAATVKLNESLKTVISLNATGTQRVLLLCRKMKQLKVQ